MRIRFQRCVRVFKNLDRQRAADRRKVLEKHLERITGFEVFEENPDWHACADEHGCSPEYLRVDDHGRRFHGDSMRLRIGWHQDKTH